MTEYHVDIVGMTCDHCVRAVRSRLEKTPGVTVKNVAVGSADFALDDAKSSMTDIEEAISDEGYTVDTVTAR